MISVVKFYRVYIITVTIARFFPSISGSAMEVIIRLHRCQITLQYGSDCSVQFKERSTVINIFLVSIYINIMWFPVSFLDFSFLCTLDLAFLFLTFKGTWKHYRLVKQIDFHNKIMQGSSVSWFFYIHLLIHTKLLSCVWIHIVV